MGEIDIYTTQIKCDKCGGIMKEVTELENVEGFIFKFKDYLICDNCGNKVED